MSKENSTYESMENEQGQTNNRMEKKNNNFRVKYNSISINSV